jgi:hypothetical protein
MLCANISVQCDTQENIDNIRFQLVSTVILSQHKPKLNLFHDIQFRYPAQHIIKTCLKILVMKHKQTLPFLLCFHCVGRSLETTHLPFKYDIIIFVVSPSCKTYLCKTHQDSKLLVNVSGRQLGSSSHQLRPSHNVQVQFTAALTRKLAVWRFYIITVDS